MPKRGFLVTAEDVYTSWTYERLLEFLLNCNLRVVDFRYPSAGEKFIGSVEGLCIANGYTLAGEPRLIVKETSWDTSKVVIKASLHYWYEEIE